MKKRLGFASLRASVSSLALAMGCLALAHPAAAQASAPAQPANGPVSAAPAADQGGGQPEVTVTAERRTVSLQTAPVAAAVVSGHQLTQRGIYTVD